MSLFGVVVAVVVAVVIDDDDGGGGRGGGGFCPGRNGKIAFGVYGLSVYITAVAHLLCLAEMNFQNILCFNAF